MIELAYENQVDALQDDYETLFKELLQLIVQQQQLNKKCEVSVTIVSLATIQEINKSYRGIDQPTDVISFAFNDEPDAFVLPDDFVTTLGDIMICFDKAQEQAVQYEHSLKREMAFLFVHGMLHLLGYDHQTKVDEQKMISLQEEILNEANIKR